MPLEPGSTIEGRYEILRAVRSGGMGAVYEARDLRLPDAPCAVKEMRQVDSDLAPSEALRRKFAEEARFLSTLHHPGIPRVRDFFVRDGVCYLVMDLIRGQDLEAELREQLGAAGQPPAAERVVQDSVAVLGVLEYLHAQDPPVVHRDVKPANVLREAVTGRVRLVDFGLAQAVRADSATRTSSGTLAYCPLEQMQGRAEPRSDLYAVGATMVHLLTGQEPRALDVVATVDEHPDRVDPDLAALLERACAFEAERRYGSATEMKGVLEDWLEARRAGLSAPPTLQGNLGAAEPGRRARLWRQVEPEAPKAVPAGTFSTALALFTVVASLAILVAVGLLRQPPAGSSGPTVEASAASRTAGATAPSLLPRPSENPSAPGGTGEERRATAPSPGRLPAARAPWKAGQQGGTAAPAPAVSPPRVQEGPRLSLPSPAYPQGATPRSRSAPPASRSTAPSQGPVTGEVPLPPGLGTPPGWSLASQDPTTMAFLQGKRQVTLVARAGAGDYPGGLGSYLADRLGGGRVVSSSATDAVLEGEGSQVVAHAFVGRRNHPVILLAVLDGAAGDKVGEISRWLEAFGPPSREVPLPGMQEAPPDLQGPPGRQGPGGGPWSPSAQGPLPRSGDPGAPGLP